MLSCLKGVIQIDRWGPEKKQRYNKGENDYALEMYTGEDEVS